MIDLDALMAKADEIFEARETELVPVVLAGKALGVRFLPIAGDEWQLLVLKHPPRTDILQDMNLGYNVDDVVAAYPNLALVDGDDVDDMIRPGEDGKPVSVWPKIWKRLSKNGRKDVATAIWAAHERTPERLVEVAGKASSGSQRKKRS